MPSIRPLVRAAISVTGILAIAAPAQAQAATPSPSSTYRGEGVDPGALIRHRTDTVIKAPLSTIWKLQTDVERWPA